MQIYATQLKIITVIVVVVVLLLSGWHLYQKHSNNREAACQRAARTTRTVPNQELSFDDAVCSGLVQPQNQ